VCSRYGCPVPFAMAPQYLANVKNADAWCLQHKTRAFKNNMRPKESSYRGKVNYIRKSMRLCSTYASSILFSDGEGSGSERVLAAASISSASDVTFAGATERQRKGRRCRGMDTRGISRHLRGRSTLILKLAVRKRRERERH